jgi:exopolyphosphatase/guanosine-5'-triphosphate,3'-diphosphate pyrophosphatase
MMTITNDQSKKYLANVMKLAKSCHFESGHTLQVTRLALRLFDEFKNKALHELGTPERFILQCAALLHDIGWIKGQQKHHKTALHLILESPLLTFDERHRLLIGSIARYHRKALPQKSHDHFAALSTRDQRIVSILSALLRVADGLDRTHSNVIRDLTCKVTPKKIILTLDTAGPAEEERREALEKADLLQKVYARKLDIRCPHGSS